MRFGLERYVYSKSEELFAAQRCALPVAGRAERGLGLGAGFCLGVGKSPKTPQNPACQVHAVLGSVCLATCILLEVCMSVC